MEGLKVIVVDDDPDFGELIRVKLLKELAQLDVRTFTSGQDCLDHLRVSEADCVVSDYQMPGMNGMELLASIREQGNEVPFIFVTGQGNEEVARQAFKKGAFDYFTKDVGRLAYYSRIANSIQKAVSQKRMEYEALRKIAGESVCTSSVRDFSGRLRYLAEVLGVEHAFIGRFRPEENTVETLSVYANGAIVDNITYNVLDTPCENVVKKWACCYPKNVQSLFPKDELLVEMGIEGYAGVPLYDSEGMPIGILVVLGTSPLVNEELIKSLLMMFAARFSAELEETIRTGA